MRVQIYVAICVVVAAQRLRCSYHGFVLVVAVVAGTLPN